MIDLSVRDLVKSYDVDQNILDGLTFDVQAGERVGIMGRNGAGKTTLFKILTGEIGYDTGEITFAPNKKVGLISQIPNSANFYKRRTSNNFTAHSIFWHIFHMRTKIHNQFQFLRIIIS